MSDWWWIAGLAVYLAVGLTVLHRLARHHPDFAPTPDGTWVALLLAWPLVIPLALIGWRMFRGPRPSRTMATKVVLEGIEPPPAGRALSDLRPHGTVEVAGRSYAATVEGEFVAAGAAVAIVGRSGRTLKVRGA